MTYVRKFNGRTEEPNNTPIIGTYTCREHGEFDVEVRRDAKGEAPDEVECPVEVSDERARNHASAMMSGTWSHSKPGGDEPTFSELGEFCTVCREPATWTPSPSIACRVRRVEVVRGKWERPERKTYLDTRELGEGQSMEEFRAKREKVWEERRREDIKEMLR